jgi:hypothetical protein
MLQSSLFSTGPEFRMKGRKLIVRTSPVARSLTLGLLDRTMTVDPDKKRVRVRDRRFWFGARVETYPFDLITAISYHLSSANHSGSVYSNNSVEAYAVGLKLYGYANPDVHLFRFIGEGRFSNNGPLPSWVYWYESLTDICGTHEEKAQMFVTALGWVLNKPIVPR